MRAVDKSKPEIATALRKHYRSDFRNCAQLRALSAQIIFGSLSLHKLSDLLTDMADHLQEMIVRCSNLPAEAFDDTKDLFSKLNWEAEGAMQPVSDS
jgi:hypothetical protein